MEGHDNLNGRRYTGKNTFADQSESEQSHQTDPGHSRAHRENVSMPRRIPETINDMRPAYIAY